VTGVRDEDDQRPRAPGFVPIPAAAQKGQARERVDAEAGETSLAGNAGHTSVIVKYPSRKECPRLDAFERGKVLKFKETYTQYIQRWNRTQLPQGCVREKPPTLLDQLSPKIARVIMGLRGISNTSALTEAMVSEWMEERISMNCGDASVLSKIESELKSLHMSNKEEDCSVALCHLWGSMMRVIDRYGGESKLMAVNPEDDNELAGLKVRVNKSLGKFYAEATVPSAMREHLVG
jgi:hypothetical protein